MTFYNIVFGLLFIGAFREVIYALAEGPDWNLFTLAGTLSLLVFSDTIYTAVVIEGKRYRYSPLMMVLDLLSFILLSLAVVILNPATNDIFEVDATPLLGAVVRATGWTPEALFWSLLAFYMVILVIWNVILGVGRVMWCYRWVRWIQPALALVFAVMAVVTSRAADPDAALRFARWTIFALMPVYLVGFKGYTFSVLDAVVTLKPLTEADVATIHGWPPYPPPIDMLDYALRPGGWLDQYPDSSTNRRYGIWQREKLVGFSLLTDLEDGAAEFYIALRADHTRKNLGREGTMQTIRLGFRDHGLQRIHLKVREGYRARRLYARIGFRECGGAVEPILGKPVKFVLMEMHRRPAFNQALWSAILNGVAKLLSRLRRGRSRARSDSANRP